MAGTFRATDDSGSWLEDESQEFITGWLRMLHTDTMAWTAFMRQDYQLAASIWFELMAAAKEQKSLVDSQLGYSQVLLALKRYAEAEVILGELYENTGDSRCLHLQGWLALMQGRLDISKAHFLAEQASCSRPAPLAQGLTAYGLSLIAYRQGLLSVAHTYALLSLDCLRKIESPFARSCIHQLLRDIRAALTLPEERSFEAAGQSLPSRDQLSAASDCRYLPMLLDQQAIG